MARVVVIDRRCAAPLSAASESRGGKYVMELTYPKIFGNVIGLLLQEFDFGQTLMKIEIIFNLCRSFIRWADLFVVFLEIVFEASNLNCLNYYSVNLSLMSYAFQMSKYMYFL